MLYNLFKLVICLIISLAAGGIGAIFTTPAIGAWYAGLNKPFFTPPNWLFGPAWTILYIFMGIAAFLVWRQGLSAPKVKSALLVFLIQLILNTLWSVVFFGYHQLLGGIVVIVILWIAILITLLKFWSIDRIAGVLFIPYLAWVTFASTLNVAVWMLN